MKKYTHAELCKKAVSWLKRGHTLGGCGCPNAFSEIPSGSNGGEIADAIGIKTADGTETIVVEVKTSRADFRADAKKVFRVNSEQGMGNYRYYLCPEGLIKESELPTKWGLIYVGSRGKLSVVCGHRNGNKEDWFFESNREAELGMASILLAKTGDFELLTQTMRHNSRLEAKVKALQQELNTIKAPLEMQKMLDGLDLLLNEVETK